VNFGDPAQRQPSSSSGRWQVPVLRDERANLTIPESTVIIEYLDRHYPGRTRLLSDDRDTERQIRLPIASTTCICTCTCRRWWATGCDRRQA
jgi:glutathione S-transferase